MTMSLKFKNDCEIKVSSDLMDLMKKMMSYHESDRIDWHQLFNHPIFEKITFEDRMVRQSIGRNLQAKHLSQILDNTLPLEFYNYIEQNKDLNLEDVLSRAINVPSYVQSFAIIYM